jgi:hypothetical protein
MPSPAIVTAFGLEPTDQFQFVLRANFAVDLVDAQRQPDRPRRRVAVAARHHDPNAGGA